MRTTLLVSVSVLALAGSAYADGNDHFNAGIDAGGCSVCGGSFTDGQSSASNSDMGSDGLTQRDREVMASLTNSTWGTLVDIENNKAKYQDGNRTYIVDIKPPAAKPAPRAVPRRAPQPAPAQVDMGPINAPPLQVADFTPAPVAVQAPVEMPQISPPQPDPIAAIVDARPRKNTHFADLEAALRTIGRRRINQPAPGAPLTHAERTLSRALNMAYGATAGAIVRGSGLTRRPGLEGAIFGLATSEAKRYLSGKTPMDAVARNILHMDAKEWATHERVARRLSKPERERIIDAARDVARENRRERNQPQQRENRR